jgi:hypothetical protein
VGASPNLIEASWLALADGIEYGLAVASGAAAQAAEQKTAAPARAQGGVSIPAAKGAA